MSARSAKKIGAGAGWWCASRNGALVIRGSVSLDKVSELFGVRLDADEQHSAATTIAGLLNSLAGHVPRNGEIIDADGVQFGSG